MKIKKTMYIQAEKSTWNKEFEVVVNPYHAETDKYKIVIDIDEAEVEVEVPVFTQEQFTNGHVDQLRAMKEKLKADTCLQIQSLDEQIESLLALECK